jgi:hypothetical protein
MFWHKRSRGTVALVTALGVLAAVAGCWLLRVDSAPRSGHPSEASSLAGIHKDLAHAATPVSKAPLKSAGLRRGRPPLQPRLAPLPQLPGLLIALQCNCFGLSAYHANAPSTTYAECDLLTQLCIDRR